MLKVGRPDGRPGVSELHVERIGKPFEIAIKLKEQLHKSNAGIIVNFSVVEYVDKGQRKEDARSREFSREPIVRHGVQLLSGKVFPNKSRHERGKLVQKFVKLMCFSA